jgi:iron complex outermembrane recepter protein
MSMRWWTRGAAIVTLLFCLPSALLAQDAAITGIVTDATSAVLPGVTVTAVNLDNGGAASAVSDASGAYRLPLRPGVYKVTAELASFTPAVRERVEVAAGAPAVVDLGLTLSGLAETVSVTGTHIRSTTFEALVPLQVESRKDIETKGLANFSDVFKEIPGNAGSEAANEATPRAGQAQFNLRGLGYSSTLTLINGRRAGVAPVSDESGAEFTDVNQFPLAMVERVDVLKDGASAIYGSDAVAGVVNVVTRRGFHGVEASAGFQDATNNNGFLNLASGRNFKRGMVNLYATYFNQTGNKRTDFDWLVERVGGNGVLGRSQLINATANPSTYRPGGLNANGQPIGLTGGVNFADPDCEAAGGVFRINDDGSVDRSQCLYNFADQVGFIPDASRLQVFSELSYQLTAQMRVSSEVSFSRNVLETVKGPGSYGNGSTVANGAGNVYIPASHPFNFFQRDPSNPNRLVYIGPQNWNPAVNQAVDLVTSMRPLGGDAYNGDNAPKRRSRTNYPRVGGSLDVALGRSWVGNAAYQYAGADLSDRQPLRYRADALNQAILSGAFNPFGTAITNPVLVSPKDRTSVAGNSQAVIDQFITDSTDTAKTTQHEVDLTASGDLFSLGAQRVRLAAGGQFRRTTLDSVPDALQAAGKGDLSTLQFPQSGSQNVAAAFAEAAVPIGTIAATQFAARFEDYGKYGSTVNPKLAGSLALGRMASLRASWGTSFQAPTLFQTSRSTTRIFLSDPVSLINGILMCQNTNQTSNVTINTQGDSNLEPQHSTNYNIGGVVEPIQRVQLSLDYWNYHYTDLIAGSASPQAILNNDCNDGIPNDPRVVRDFSSGGVAEINTSFVNVGKVDTDGIDFAMAMRWQLAGSTIAATIDATWLRRFDVEGGEGGVFTGAGSRNFNNNFRTMPKWRGVAGVNWTCRAQYAGAKVRYIGSYTNDQSNNARIDDFAPLDLAYGYTVSSGGRPAWTMMVGLDNVFDLDPPALVRNDANGVLIPSTNFTYIDRPGYDAYSGADLRGRVLWLRLSHTF